MLIITLKKCAKVLVFNFKKGYNDNTVVDDRILCVNVLLLGKGVVEMNNEQTMTFSVCEDKELELRKNLTLIYDALREKGYNPINQIVGYILSEDPTYITTYNNARSLIRHIDRDELLQVLVKAYLDE